MGESICLKYYKQRKENIETTKATLDYKIIDKNYKKWYNNEKV